ncbi:MAG TPA: flagellar export chaperone FliS [Pseudomonadales bacterium]|nr:flagellar export chaperone FliS [Pseudomonadales bacterium]
MVETTRAMNAYTKQNVESAIAGASPHQLISMLYDGAIRFINTAKFHMQSGDIPQKGLAISRAIGCIESGLRGALNKEAGGGLADNLDALYDYMSNKLLMANIKNDLAALDEVTTLLHELKDGWDQIGMQTEPQKAPVPPAPPANRDSNSYGKA